MERNEKKPLHVDSDDDPAPDIMVYFFFGVRLSKTQVVSRGLDILCEHGKRGCAIFDALGSDSVFPCHPVLSLTLTNNRGLRMDIPDHEMRLEMMIGRTKFETLLRFDQVSSSYFSGVTRTILTYSSPSLRKQSKGHLNLNGKKTIKCFIDSPFCF
jgi:hypothetical protein